MFEMLKFLVESLGKVLPGLKHMRERSDYTKMGVELLLFYDRANQSLVLGRELTSALRTYVSRMSDHLRTGNDPYALTAGHWVDQNVRMQAGMLPELQRSYRRLSLVLGPLMNNDSFHALDRLVGNKLSAVTALRNMMQSGQLPFDLTMQFERLLPEQLGTQLQNIIPMETFRYYAGALARIPTNVPWEAEVLTVIQQYLQVRRPEEQLIAISVLLEVVRKAIVDNFELKDVLLAVADNRLAAFQGD